MKINISHILQIIFFAIFTFGCTDSTIDADSVLSLVDRTISGGGTEDPNKTPDVSYSLNVDVTNIEIESSDEWSGTFTITSNDKWTVSSSSSWVTLSPLSGNGNATVSVKVDEYLSNDSNAVDRTATIVVKGEHSGSKEISLSQKSPVDDEKSTYAILVDGKTFNKTIKELSNGSGYPWYDDEINIKEININCRSNKISSTIVSSKESSVPVYVSYDNGVVTISTIADYIECSDNMSCMFSGLRNISSVDLSSFNMEKVTDLSGFFMNCFSLNSLDLSNFDSHNVTNMSSMFNDCYSLNSLDLSSFDTQNVTNMSSMFEGCINLITLDLSNFNTQNVTKMNWMFEGCSNLSTLDLRGFDTRNVTDMSDMFAGMASESKNCNIITLQEIKSILLEKFESIGLKIEYISWSILDEEDPTESSVILVYGKTFNETIKKLANGGVLPEDKSDYKIKEIRVNCNSDKTSFDIISSKNSTTPIYVDYNDGIITLNTLSDHIECIGDMSSMFENCYSLTTLDLSNFNTVNVTNMYRMFYACHSLKTLDLISFNTHNVTDMSYMFSGCSDLTTLDLSNFKTDNVTNMRGMFYACHGLKTLDLININTVNVTDMADMFNDCYSLTALNLSSFNTHNVTDMSYMFMNCDMLSSLDLSGFNTQNVTRMYSMFYRCSNLLTLDLSSFDTKNVTDMTIMFGGCSNLSTLDLSSFNTQNVKRMSGMFSGCSNLLTLDLSSFDTKNVTEMNLMFKDCKSLSTLDLSNFNTQNVTKMDWMFRGCSNLSTLDLSSFDTYNVTDMSYMFNDCKSLSTLDLSIFNILQDTNIENMCNNMSEYKKSCNIITTQKTKDVLIGRNTGLKTDYIKWTIIK